MLTVADLRGIVRREGRGERRGGGGGRRRRKRKRRKKRKRRRRKRRRGRLVSSLYSNPL